MAKDISITDTQLSGQQPKPAMSQASNPVQTPQQVQAQVAENSQATTLPPQQPTSPNKKGFGNWIETKVKPWWAGKQPWQKILISLVLITIVLGGLGAGAYFYIFSGSKSPLTILDVTKSYIEKATSLTLKQQYQKVATQLPQPDEPRTQESALNGLLFTKQEMDEMKKRAPVAVMTNNHIQARPQSGLSSADIVYEALAESGITRYMAIYWSEGPQKVGPIRSARQYYLEWLSPFDPLYIYDGCALTEDVRTNACGNIYTYGIKNIATIGAWRVNDGTRFAPHNEYSSVVNTWEYAANRDWDEFPTTIQSLKFKKDAKTEDRGQKTRVKATFRTDLSHNGIYDSEWVYDPTSNTYLHRIGGQADLDLETGRQVNAKVVIVERVAMQSAGDDHGRIIQTTIGQGDAVILQDGKIVQGTWKKDSRTARTRYYNSGGQEIELNRGRIWIMAVPRDQGKFDIIEQ